MLHMTRRSPKERKKAPIAKLLIQLTLLLLILQRRNPFLQGNYASGARLHTAKNTLPHVKLRHAVCDGCGSERAITRKHANKQVTSQLNRNLILQVEFTQPLLQECQKDSTMNRVTGFQSLHEYKRMQSR